MIERIVINNRILNEQGCFLTGINGLGYAGYDVTTIKPVYMYGWNVTHGKPKGFTFSLELLITGKTMAELAENRTRVFGILNTIDRYGVHVMKFERADGVVLQLDAVGYDAPSEIKAQDGLSSRVMIKFVSTASVLKSETPTTVRLDLEATRGGMTVPMDVPMDMGTDLGDAGTIVTNYGNASVGVYVEYHPELNDPVITNVTTGIPLQLNAEVLTGKWWIDTDRYIAKNDLGYSVVHLFLGISEFHIVAGENLLRLTSSDGNDEGYAMVTFANGYANL